MGDIPAEDLSVVPTRAGEPIDLSQFDSVDTVFRGPDGDTIAAEFFATIDGDSVVIEWPEDSVIEEAGRYELTLILESTGGFRETVAPLAIIAQDPALGWHTLDSTRDAWGDAPDDDETLFELLEVAKEAVIEYAPPVVGDLPPVRFRKAQLMQARNLWNSTEVNPAGEAGADGYTIAPHPLDWQITQILRPNRGAGLVG